MKHHDYMCVFLCMCVVGGLCYMFRCFCPRQSYVISVSPFVLLMKYSVLNGRATKRVSIPADFLCYYKDSMIMISEDNSFFRLTAIAKAQHLSSFACSL